MKYVTRFLIVINLLIGFISFSLYCTNFGTNQPKTKRVRPSLSIVIPKTIKAKGRCPITPIDRANKNKQARKKRF